LIFEDALRRARQVGKLEKMKMRSRMRSELLYALRLTHQKPQRIFSRWEDKITDVLSLSLWLRDDLHSLFSTIFEKKKKKGTHGKKIIVDLPLSKVKKSPAKGSMVSEYVPQRTNYK
jgi:hypothetical protein